MITCVQSHKKILAILSLVLMLSACVGSSSSEQEGARFGDVPIAYVKRVTPRDDDGVMMPSDLSDIAAFFPGAHLFVRDAASMDTPERNITAGLFDGPIDIRDLSVSADGSQLVFSLRAPEIEDADEDEQPTWNIWLLNVRSGELRRVIANDLVAEEGQDIQPAFLPDGRIVFVSDRQRQSRARLLDEGKPQFAPQEEERQDDAFALHVMSADGSAISQATFNMSHDLYPAVRADGRVAFLRWDNKDLANEFNFYTVQPDGRDPQLLYGADSHDAADGAPVWSSPEYISPGQLLVMRRPQESANWSVLPTLINVGGYADIDQPVDGGTGNAQQRALTLSVGVDAAVVSTAGRVAAAVPLRDGTSRYLVAWSPCRMVDGFGALYPCTADTVGASGLREAEPAYGLWIMDPRTATQRLVAQVPGNRMITDVAVFSSVSAATAIADGQPGVDLDQALYDRQAGILDIRSVYDFAGVFDPLAPLPDGVVTLEDFRDPALVTNLERRAQFLRIVKGVLIPNDDIVELDRDDIGRAPVLGMREIVGYAPVAPDGSVRVEVPANVPLGLQLVDRNGRAILPRHGSWLSVTPGETLVCGGCHAANDEAIHGRRDAEPININAGAAITGPAFANTRPELFADAGDTMAQVLTRVEPQWLEPNPDMVFEDVWTDPMVRPVDDSWTLSYNDLTTPRPVADAPPGGDDCIDDWQPLCRTVIHYLDHIQPLWDLPRTVDIEAVPTDVTCTNCHSRTDVMAMPQIPEAQLELTATVSGDSTENVASYRELLFADNAVTIEDDAFVDLLVPLLDGEGQPVFQTDENGELILDEFDQPIPVLVTVPVAPPMVAGSAALSPFFTVFEPAGSHEGWLTDAELRLLSEWLDIGGQYYNDPFAVPQ